MGALIAIAVASTTATVIIAFLLVVIGFFCSCCHQKLSSGVASIIIFSFYNLIVLRLVQAIQRIWQACCDLMNVNSSMTVEDRI